MEIRHPSELAERLRQLAESQHMDFASPDVALTLHEAADALTRGGDVEGSIVPGPEMRELGRFAPIGGRLRATLAWHASVTTELQRRMVQAQHYVRAHSGDAHLLGLLEGHPSARIQEGSSDD